MRMRCWRRPGARISSNRKRVHGLSAEQMARMEHEMDGLHREFKADSASSGDTVLNLVVASGYLSSLLGNARVSGYLESTTLKS
jgi:hypothetical protein